MKGDLWGLFLLTDAAGNNYEGLLRTHDLLDCAPHACSLHAPSAHHMRTWRLHWRANPPLMERVCPEHGTGHPDPDHLGHIARTLTPADAAVAALHGCCGCCRPTEESTDE